MGISAGAFSGGGTTLTAEIANDITGYKKLMILGNTQTSGTTVRDTVVFDNLTVVGSIAKAAGSFLIDHPLAPESKNLYHSFVEGPRADLIYRGEVRLVNGRAEINLDTDAVDASAQKMTTGTFVALTQNAKVYSLNNAEGFTRVRSTPIVDGKFTIIAEDETCTDEINWLVVAERHDAYMLHGLTSHTDSNGHLLLEVEKTAHDPVSWAEVMKETVVNATSDDPSIPHVAVENILMPSPGTQGFPMHMEQNGFTNDNLMKQVITVTEFPVETPEEPPIIPPKEDSNENQPVSG
jgi:hypothetical protein